MINLAIAIPRAMAWMVDPVSRRFGFTYDDLAKLPVESDEDRRAYDAVLQFWIKFSWIVLTLVAGFATMVGLFVARYGGGYPWFSRYGGAVVAPLFFCMVFGIVMVMIEALRESVQKWCPARPYDVIVAAALAALGVIGLLQ